MKKSVARKTLAILIAVALLTTNCFAITESGHYDDCSSLSSDCTSCHHADSSHEHYTIEEEANNTPDGSATQALAQENKTSDVKESKNPIESSRYFIKPENLSDEVKTEELEYSAKTLKKDINDISCVEILRDIQKRPLFLLVEFSAGGYIIILRTNLIPLEYSYTSLSSPYSNVPDKAKLYLGAFKYAFEEDGESFIIGTNERLKRADVQKMKSWSDILVDNVNRELNIDATRESTTVYPVGEAQSTNNVQSIQDYTYFLSMPFGFNEHGDCGPTAAAMLLRYFDSNVNENMIDLSAVHYDQDWKELFKTYSPHEYDSTEDYAGTVSWDEKETVNTYLGTEKANLRYQAVDVLLPGYNTLCDALDSGSPVVLYATFNDPELDADAHAVLSYNYDYINLSFAVHNGWHYSENFTMCPDYNNLTCEGGERTETWISRFLVGSALWLESLPTSHEHSFTVSVHDSNMPGRQFDYYNCSGCNLIRRLPHEHDWSLWEGAGEDGEFRVCVPCESEETRPHTFDEYYHEGYTDSQVCEYGGTLVSDCITCEYSKVTVVPPGHIPGPEASCTTPQVCTRCHEILAEAEHNYSEPTCTSPKICTRCGATSGSSLGHSYRAATCIKRATCIRCGRQTGSYAPHVPVTYDGGRTYYCRVCGTLLGSINAVPPEIIELDNRRN